MMRIFINEAPGTFGAFVSGNYLSIAGASLLLPITGEFKFPLPTPKL